MAALRLDLEAGDEVVVTGPARFKLRKKTGRIAVVDVEAPLSTCIERVRVSKPDSIEKPPSDVVGFSLSKRESIG